MKSFIDNNVMEIADLEVSAEGKISESLVVKKVRPSYMKDAEVFFASLFCIKLQKIFVGCCTCIL